MKEILGYLPAVNATLISTSGIFIIAGIRAIKRHDEQLHKRNMLIATTLAAIFLVFYLTRIILQGNTPFTGPDWVRPIYFGILIPHLILALVQTPLTLVTLWHAYKENWAKHRKIARITYPIWIFVAFSGVAVFGFLHFPY